MEAVTKELRGLIIQLQSLPYLADFALAGGTGLAIRFNHRISNDIDLFTSKMIGKSGFEAVKDDLKKEFANALQFCEIINVESGDQYCFLRGLIATRDTYIKIEMIQNIQLVSPIEIYEGIRVLSLEDVGLMKLLSASSRKAKKDIYDLDFITNNIPLDQLIYRLGEKQQTFNKEEHKCLFDLDNDPSPVDNPGLLLEFDNTDYTSLPGRPSHSTDRIEILPTSKTWPVTRSSWRKKVRELMKGKGMEFPKIKPMN